MEVLFLFLFFIIYRKKEEVKTFLNWWTKKRRSKTKENRSSRVFHFWIDEAKNECQRHIFAQPERTVINIKNERIYKNIVCVRVNHPVRGSVWDDKCSVFVYRHKNAHHSGVHRSSARQKYHWYHIRTGIIGIIRTGINGIIKTAKFLLIVAQFCHIFLDAVLWTTGEKKFRHFRYVILTEVSEKKNYTELKKKSKKPTLHIRKDSKVFF